MTKPDDIPQDVWEAASDAHHELTNSHAANETIIARTIMAERERCASMAERIGKKWGWSVAVNLIVSNIRSGHT